MIKYISIVSIILIKIISTALATTSQKYSKQVNTSIGSTVSSIGLIQSYKFKSKFECLGQCNLKTDCYTATYSSDSSLLDNCALYSKYFATSDLVSLKNTNLYSKDCEWILSIIISLLI